MLNYAIMVIKVKMSFRTRQNRVVENFYWWILICKIITSNVKFLFLLKELNYFVKRFKCKITWEWIYDDVKPIFKSLIKSFNEISTKINF
jgi:hypothetical protein